MTRLAHKRIGRAALALVLLLLMTQLAFANQLCHGLALVRGDHHHAAQVLAQPRDVSNASATTQPCCDAHPTPAHICLAADTGADFVPLGSSHVPLPDLAAPRENGAPVFFNFSLAATSVSSAWAHPPPQPSYLVFGRFLS